MTRINFNFPNFKTMCYCPSIFTISATMLDYYQNTSQCPPNCLPSVAHCFRFISLSQKKPLVLSADSTNVFSLMHFFVQQFAIPSTILGFFLPSQFRLRFHGRVEYFFSSIPVYFSLLGDLEFSARSESL